MKIPAGFAMLHKNLKQNSRNLNITGMSANQTQVFVNFVLDWFQLLFKFWLQVIKATGPILNKTYTDRASKETSQFL